MPRGRCMVCGEKVGAAVIDASSTQGDEQTRAAQGNEVIREEQEQEPSRAAGSNARHLSRRKGTILLVYILIIALPLARQAGASCGVLLVEVVKPCRTNNNTDYYASPTLVTLIPSRGGVLLRCIVDSEERFSTERYSLPNEHHHRW